MKIYGLLRKVINPDKEVVYKIKKESKAFRNAEVKNIPRGCKLNIVLKSSTMYNSGKKQGMLQFRYLNPL